MDGCSLFGYVVQQDCLTEELAVDCLHQLLSALQYLHTHHIAHLDIKVCSVCGGVRIHVWCRRINAVRMMCAKFKETVLSCTVHDMCIQVGMYSETSLTDDLLVLDHFYCMSLKV